MDLFLARFAETLPAGMHAVLMLDQAGWHGRATLQVPNNVTLAVVGDFDSEAVVAEVKRLTAGHVVFDAIRRGVAIYSPHTALDVVDGGTNDMLADVLGLPPERSPLRLAQGCCSRPESPSRRPRWRSPSWARRRGSMPAGAGRSRGLHSGRSWPRCS